MVMPAILSVSLLTIMAPTAVAPALAAIKDAFPGISEAEAKFVVTLPTYVMVPMGLIAARMASKMDKKKLLLIGMTIFLIFGVAGGLVNDFTHLLIMRIIFGLGLGIMTPLATSLIFDFTTTTQERSKLLGIQGASNQLGGLVFMSLSGVLAAISWRLSFMCYAFVLVSLFLTVFFMPSIPPPPARKPAQDGKAKSEKMSWKVFVLAFFAMMIFACFFVVNTDLAIFMQVSGLGGAEDCGYALSIMRIPAIISGMCIALIMKKLGDWTVPIAAVIMAVGYVIIANAYSYPVLMAGCLVVGLGGGFALPPISLFLPRIVTARQRTLAVAIITSVAQCGQAISPTYTSLFVSDTCEDPYRARFIVSAVTTVIIAALFLAFTYILPKKPVETNENQEEARCQCRCNVSN